MLRSKTTTLATAIACFFFAAFVYAQNCSPTLFYFPGDNYRRDYHIDRTLDDNYLLVGEVNNNVAGSGDDIHLIKTDDFGNEIWSTTLIWPGDESASAVKVLPDGSAVIVGTTDSESIATAERSILLVKISEAGELLWWRTYGESASASYTGTDVEVLANGSFVMSGTQSFGFSSHSMVFLTADPNGQQTQWATKSLFVEDVIHGTGANFGLSSAYNVSILANGDYVFTGITYPDSFAWPTGGFMSVVRTTSTLNTVWETADPFGFCLVGQGWDVEETEDGTLLIAGRTVVDGCYDAFGGFMLFRMTGDGELLDNQYIGESGGLGIMPAGDGNYIIARGRSIAKIDHFGETLWESPEVGGFRSGAGNSLVASNNGGYILSGYRENAVVMIEFDSLGNACVNSLSGIVFSDEDNDCERDSSETLLSNLIVELNDGEQFANTNPEGWYYLQCDTGNYEVQLHAPNALWEVSCPLTTDYDLYLEDIYDDESDLDFGLRAAESCALLNVDVTLGWARACTQQVVAVSYSNLGTQAATNVYVELELDDQLTFVDADLPWELIDDKYRIAVEDLAPLQTGSFRAHVMIACDAEIDTEVCVNSTIFPATSCSLEEGHPTEQHCRTVRNSYDPNDKLVVAADTFSCWKTALDELEYTIRFQNTGNDTAFQVVILDTLPDALDMTTVRPGPSSHAYTMRMIGSNQLMFSFTNINLLDSLSDPAASQGFVQFSVHPKPTIADGTVIGNRAAIYFDHNPPIFTPEVYIGQCVNIPLVIAEVTSQEVTNCAAPNGKLSIIAAGGEGAYEYSINGGMDWQASPEFLDLDAGEYEVLLRDANEEEYAYPYNPVSVDEFLPILLWMNNWSPTSCGGDNGRIRLQAVAPGPIMYSIDGGETFGPEPDFYNLTEGIYTVMILNECMEGDTLDVTLTDPTPPEITAVSWEAPNCDGFGGSIEIEANGVRSLRYSINNGETWRTGSTFNFLEPGVYQIVVSYGAGNCEVVYESEIELTAGGELPEIITAEVNASTSCDDDEASINIIATGGDLEYSIDGGVTYQSTPYFDGLASGVYDLVVRNECEFEATLDAVEIVSIALPELTDISLTDPTCGATDGSIEIVSGNGLDLAYSIDNWVTTQTDNTFQGLPSGSYTIAVQNEFGCQATLENMELNEAAAPNITNINTTDLGCTQTNSGSIAISAHGPEAILYSIDGGTNWSQTPTFNSLAAGAYEIMVANVGLTCVEAAPQNPVDIEASSLPIINGIEVIHPTTNTASDGSITVSAVGDAYVFFSIDGGVNWQGNHVFSGLPAGVYTITVQSGAEDCIVSQSDIVLDATVNTVEEAMEPVLNVYPNPATDHVQVQLELLTVLEVEWSLVDVLGKTLKIFPAQRTRQFSENLYLGGLPPGIYYLRLVIGGRLYQEAVIVM